MMTKSIRATLLRHAWLSLLALPVGAQAQTLTLFEPTEAGNAPREAGPAQGGIIAVPGGGGGQPAFTLRSTSRIGDNYHVVLVGRDGAISQVAWQAGQSAAVPGHGGFAVTQVAGRSVTLTQPEPCIAAPDKGVSCGVDNQAQLALATAAPAVAQAQAAQPPAKAPNQQDPFAAAAQAGGQPPALGLRGVRTAGQVIVDQNTGQPIVINPFTGQPEAVQQLSPEEQAARADRQRQRADRLRSFQGRRIDDADIPPGMQRARTPFGDTLVPIQ
jgi:hypothetical protein